MHFVTAPTLFPNFSLGGRPNFSVAQTDLLRLCFTLTVPQAFLKVNIGTRSPEFKFLKLTAVLTKSMHAHTHLHIENTQLLQKNTFKHYYLFLH